jgi:hypothetical protein
MPKNKNKNKKSKSQNAGFSDRELVSLSNSASAADRLLPSSDFSRKMPAWLLTQHPPRNFLSQIHWLRETFFSSVSLSTSVPTENNFTFNLNQVPGASKIVALYDQYCIYAVSVRVTMDSSSSVTDLAGAGRINTAIDYDSITNLSTETAIQEYGSCVSSEFVAGKSYERFIKPCAQSTVASGAAPQRLWINNANTTVPHLGFRSFFNSNTVSGVTVDYFFSLIIGMRNNI